MTVAVSDTLPHRLSGNHCLKAHRRYKSERDQLTAELETEEMSMAQQDQIMMWAAEINQGITDGDVSFEAKRALAKTSATTNTIIWKNTRLAS